MSHSNESSNPSELVQKTESQIARITNIYLLTKEEGYVTINEDKTVKFFLKRDSGQFWPSIAEYMPHVPTQFVYDEDLMWQVVDFFTCFPYLVYWWGL